MNGQEAVLAISRGNDVMAFRLLPCLVFWGISTEKIRPDAGQKMLGDPEFYLSMTGNRWSQRDSVICYSDYSVTLYLSHIVLVTYCTCHILILYLSHIVLVIYVCTCHICLYLSHIVFVTYCTCHILYLSHTVLVTYCTCHICTCLILYLSYIVLVTYCTCHICTCQILFLSHIVPVTYCNCHRLYLSHTVFVTFVHIKYCTCHILYLSHIVLVTYCTCHILCLSHIDLVTYCTCHCCVTNKMFQGFSLKPLSGCSRTILNILMGTVYTKIIVDRLWTFKVLGDFVLFSFFFFC